MPLARSGALAIAAAALGGSAPGYPDGASVLSEVNRFRTDPDGYARSLREYRKGFTSDGIMHRPTPDARPTPTLEGFVAVDEAIAALADTRPSLPVARTGVLEGAAGDLGAYQGKLGEVGHIGPAGATPGQRVQRRGGQPYGVAEVIAYGQTTPEDIVRQLVVDGGVPGRPHRRILANPYFRLAGAWCGPHRLHGSVCVIDLAAGR